MAANTTTNSSQAEVPKLTLYTSHGCPWAHRAHIVLTELGLPFSEVIIPLDRPRGEWYLKEINPVSRCRPSGDLRCSCKPPSAGWYQRSRSILPTEKSIRSSNPQSSATFSSISHSPCHLHIRKRQAASIHCPRHWHEACDVRAVRISSTTSCPSLSPLPIRC